MFARINRILSPIRHYYVLRISKHTTWHNPKMLLEKKAIDYIENNLVSLYGTRIIEGASADYTICKDESMNACLPIQIKCSSSITQTGYYRFRNLGNYQNMLLLFFVINLNDIRIWHACSNKLRNKRNFCLPVCPTHQSYQQNKIQELDKSLLELYHRYSEWHVPLISLNKRNGEDKHKSLRFGRVAEDFVFEWCNSKAYNVNRHSEISGSKYDLVVNGERVQVKSCFSQQKHGHFFVAANHRRGNKVIPYSEQDFDILAVCIGDKMTMKIKHLYWIPMAELLKHSVVSSAKSAGTTGIYLYPQQSKGKYVWLEKYRIDFDEN
eukprot:554647_1